MRTRNRYLENYAESHRHPVNQIVHMICVPVIFFATVGLGWGISPARLLPTAAAAVPSWINLATLAILPALFFYARLGLRSFLTGALWVAVSVSGCAVLQARGAPLLGLSLAAWLLAWVAQFYGHHVEGAKPSFSDDLVFLLIGPLFVQEEWARRLGRHPVHGPARPKHHAT